MPDIGRASLLIVPKFDNLTKSVNDALQKAGAAASSGGRGLGESATKGFGTGLAKSGALVGAFSSLTNAALSSISSHVGAAVSRFDTLNQYPRTMELLGYSSESAEASISKMSDRLSSLPTTLDSMTSTVQGIVAITGDLDQATDAGLALNDMLVASGSSQQLVTSAMEQFRQMLAKGKPEMEDWRSLTSAAPGQMQQLAEAMLGPTANANDLYAALGGGKNDPIFTMDQLIDKMIELDTEGGEGITSFREQAETAAGGVQTAMANMGNAVTKGIASVMDEIGKDRISGVLSDMKAGVNDAFGVARDVAADVIPVLDGAYEALAPIAPQIIATSAAFATINSVAGRAYDAISGASDGVVDFVERVGPAKIAIAGISAVVTIAAAAWADYAERQENFEAATRGLSDVVSDTASLDGYRGSVNGVGESARLAAMSVDELAEATSRRVETMRQNTEAAETEIAQLSTAQGIINEYVGATDLSADAQGRLEWALRLVNDQFGLSITQADVAAGKYKDAEGNVVDLRDSINGLIEAKKEEARVNAVTANLTEAYETQTDAAATLAKAQEDYNTQVGYWMKNVPGITRAEAEARVEGSKWEQQLRSAEEQYRTASAAVSTLEGELGEAAAATSEAADEYDRLSATMGSAKFELFSAQLQSAGTSTTMLAEDLRALGADADAFSSLSEGRLQELAYAYDGTVGSVVGMLDQWGVSMDETAAAAARASAGYRAALDEMGASEPLARAGADLDNLSQKLAAAGAGTSALAEMGSANLSRIAESCRGNTDLMVWCIQNYNDVPIVDKDGTVTVDDAKLIDAQGNVYEWNGSKLVDQSGVAAVDDASLIDAQGNVWVWNGSQLVPLSTTAQVTGNVPSGQAKQSIDDTNASVAAMSSKTVTDTVQGNALTAAPAIWDTSNAIGSMTSKDVYVNTHLTTHETTIRTIREAWGGSWGKRGRAAGGVRLNAAGGIAPRLHADGAIATRAVPLDIVGEDGAEAIVPLTNRRYSQPFADIIAEGVARRTDGSGAVVAAIEALRADIAQMGVYLDTGRLVGGISPQVNRELGKMQRRGSLA